jgi:hypothetical protein
MIKDSKLDYLLDCSVDELMQGRMAYRGIKDINFIDSFEEAVCNCGLVVISIVI